MISAQGACADPPLADPRTRRDDLVHRHRHLVDLHVRRFPVRGPLREDARQVAFLGLLYAAERFDPDRGVKFSTFADKTISGELKRFARNQGWTVRPPRSLQETYLELVATDGRLAQELGRPPTVAELARAMRCPLDRVLDAIEAGQARGWSSCESEVEDGQGSVVPWPAVDEPGYERVERAALTRRLLDGLAPVERAVVVMTVLHGMSQDATAEALGVSQAFVSRARHHALGRMRRVLERSV